MNKNVQINGNGRTLRPRVDIIEREDAVLLYTTLPGVAAEDVALTVENNELLLKASFGANLGHEESLVYAEFQPMNYVRRFTLTDVIDRDGITAELNQGILTLTLPKKAEAQPRKITVKAQA